jgi:hypothetical protein
MMQETPSFGNLEGTHTETGLSEVTTGITKVTEDQQTS